MYHDTSATAYLCRVFCVAAPIQPGAAASGCPLVAGLHHGLLGHCRPLLCIHHMCVAPCDTTQWQSALTDVHIVYRACVSPLFVAVHVSCATPVYTIAAPCTAAWQFYVLRVALGIAEGGTFPGMWYHLSTFLPEKQLGACGHCPGCWQPVVHAVSRRSDIQLCAGGHHCFAGPGRPIGCSDLPPGRCWWTGGACCASSDNHTHHTPQPHGPMSDTPDHPRPPTTHRAGSGCSFSSPYPHLHSRCGSGAR